MSNDDTPSTEDLEALADLTGQLGDFLAALDLTPEQRRTLNAGTRSIARGRRHLDNARNHPDAQD